MVHVDLDALQKIHRSAVRWIVNLTETLCLALGKECFQKGDVKAESLEPMAIEKEIDVKSKFLADLKAMPTLSADDVWELERQELPMPEK